MKRSFFQTLVELAEHDERIHLLVGDLGFSVVEEFARRFPSRFVNAGVAEQNMTGMAAGIAMCGGTVFTYSIGNFATLRCLEQIRNDVCHPELNVKVVAAGGGLAYGSLGASHHATEDLAVMRALPNMTVVAPGDEYEVKQATRAIASHAGPCYLRLGRVENRRVHVGEPAFTLGKAIKLKDGDDVAIVSTGEMLEDVLSVADSLAAQGVKATVLSMHTVKPLDEQALLEAAGKTRAIVTVEEHSLLGGLGGAVAEVLAEARLPSLRFKRLGLPPLFCHEVGDQEYLKKRLGLSRPDIAKSIVSLLSRE